MAATDDLASRFLADADSIAGGFIEVFNLRYDEDVENLASPLHRWLDFVLRYVEPASRKPHFSTGFWARVPQDLTLTVDRVVRLLCRNGDINPYQSKGLLNNDVSGKQRGQRTDLLWADWDIRHFHLTDEDVIPGQAFSKRSDWLLFALVFPDAVCCIDVRHHPAGSGFADEEPLSIAVRSWPALFEPYRLKDVLGLARTEEPTQEDIHALRRGGVSMLYEIDGAVYLSPGGGITSASTPTRVTLAANTIRHNISALADHFLDESKGPLGPCRVADVEQPDWRLCITPRGLAVYETNLGAAWLVAEISQDSGWSKMLAPAWAIAQRVGIREQGMNNAELG
ncbi:MAG: hypothetical protein M0Z85_03955 [Gammaproteobacteria bacterium]|nr:hypothetical protein [Gammaproteobacteria bacterium]